MCCIFSGGVGDCGLFLTHVLYLFPGKVYIYIYIYIYIYRKSASRFSRGTVLNTLKQSRINIMRGKKGRNYIS